MEAWDQSVSAVCVQSAASSPLGVSLLRLSPTRPRATAYRLEPPLPPGRLIYPSPSPLASTTTCRFRNINLIPITYAFRPRLRIRLTLGGLTWPRKPWAYGEQVSRLFYRYSCLHKLFQSLHPSFRSGFVATGMLPYHSLSRIRGFGSMLEPRYIFGAGSLDQ